MTQNKKNYEQRCHDVDIAEEALKRSVSLASKDEEKVSLTLFLWESRQVFKFWCDRPRLACTALGSRCTSLKIYKSLFTFLNNMYMYCTLYDTLSLMILVLMIPLTFPFSSQLRTKLGRAKTAVEQAGKPSLI